MRIKAVADADDQGQAPTCEVTGTGQVICNFDCESECPWSGDEMAPPVWIICHSDDMA
jgi:hypothetical protein